MSTLKKADLLFWVFIFLTVLLQLSNNRLLTLEAAFSYAILIVVTLRIHVVYIINKLIKRYVRKNATYTFLILAIIACLITAYVLTVEGFYVFYYFLTDMSTFSIANNGVGIFFGMLLVCVLISGGSYSIELVRQRIESEKKHQELRNNVLEMEINHLRTQLSPHYTFNILNNLQFLIRKDKEEALELLSKYSKILRYYVYESQNKWIKLDTEITFLQHYFKLEQDRCNDDLEISCQWNIPENQLIIIPFLLSTFVENAFKHVSDFTDSLNYIHLHIFLTEDNQLFLKIENTTNSELNKTRKEGVGLKFVQKRLEISYPDQYILEQIAEPNKYSVKLQLNLSEK